MEPILKTVAREYTRRYKNLKNICFLFPNKRCGIFLKKYLAEEGVHLEDLPHILTISELMAQVAKLTEAPRIQQLFALFNEYKALLVSKGVKDEEIEFESFRSWGETVLSDFNTVDMALANPDEVFKNVKDYREITSNFLTDEQKEVMHEYFGVEVKEDTGEFWKTFKNPDNLSMIQEKFVNLWQILAPLYSRFIATLEKHGLGSAGSIYRRAAARIEERGNYSLPFYKKIVAVGFNALTEAERRVFKSLQAENGYKGYDDYIDFVWDITGPILNDPSFTASRFVDYNRRQFPSPEWLLPALENEEVTEYPDISIISAPSLTSQVKIAGNILSDFVSEKGKTMIDNAEVALILPDETLLSNMLYSFPDNIGNINLTMAYTLRNTSIASFVNLLRRLYATMREGKEGKIFFVKDLKLLFSHPYSILLAGEDTIDAISDYIEENRKVSLLFNELEGIENIGFLDMPSKKSKSREIFKYLSEVLEKLKESLKNEESRLEEFDQIDIYSKYAESLQEVVEAYKVDMLPLTAMQIIDRLISAEKIGFEGEPLYGLQVMGTLESRSLDFRHVIILSMNEGIMPRKSTGSTFIPETLRKSYGLPPARYAEEIFSYYFYRLISRAEKVTLIFDDRTTSGRQGGESRYLLQLKHFVPEDKLRMESCQFEMKNRITGEADIVKTPEIMEMVDGFLKEGPGSLNLSASSLTKYRKCEVLFFLENIVNINTDPERSEYMDALTVGNVLHSVMMELYLPVEKQKMLLQTPEIIDKTRIRAIMANRGLIRGLIERKIKKYFFGREEEDGRSISSGSIELVARQIEQLVKAILEYDLNLAPFRLFGCEIEENMRVTFKSGRTVNFRFAIDRLDEIMADGKPTLRIIDYKTGKRKRTALSLEKVFNEGEGDQIFQLFTYAWLLNKKEIPGCENVRTEIYYVPDLISGVGGLPKIGGTTKKYEVKSYAEYSEEFDRKFNDLVESLFVSPVFKGTSKASLCLYCPFRLHCNK